MRYAAGADHAGVGLKDQLVTWLRSQGVEVEDLGTHSEASVDYPDYGARVARAVAQGRADRGVLVCGTGIGIGIAANKVRGVRAATVSEPFSARMAVQHNDAQILCLGARVVGPGLALDILAAFHGARFEGGRHALRVEKLRALDEDPQG